jgi:hypothetical protein
MDEGENSTLIVCPSLLLADYQLCYKCVILYYTMTPLKSRSGLIMRGFTFGEGKLMIEYKNMSIKEETGMSLEDIKNYVMQNFSETEQYFILCHMIEKFVSKDRQKEFLLDCGKVFDRYYNE